MAQLGFVIDQSRCIGCHACTIACKSENSVPVGAFRTWVKYTERGTFPRVKRSFAILRCNQCTEAPCMAICPTGALFRREDGIVDLDAGHCVGCKGCMQACPYDALYIDEDSGTAEKCHFCAHRTEVGLAPACAVVCPTEAIIPGDFDDPQSRVSRLRVAEDLAVRKPEAGTEPNVFYREVDEAGIDPQLTSAAEGYLWAQRLAGPQVDAELFEALEDRAEARTVYNVDRRPLWGWKITGYLYTKSLAAGLPIAAAFFTPSLTSGERIARGGWIAVLLLALLFLGLTSALLVFDLKRPDRFLKILMRPNWRSWLVRGSVVLMVYGALLTLMLVLAIARLELEPGLARTAIIATMVAGAGAAVYSAWLLRQARGRVFWLRLGMEVDLLLHAGIAGTASLLLLALWFDIGLSHAARTAVAVALVGCFVAHLLYTLVEDHLAPSERKAEYRRVARLVAFGPYWGRHWGLAVVLGIFVPCTLIIGGWGFPQIPWTLAAVCALVGLYVEEDTFIRAGQALPIS